MREHHNHFCHQSCKTPVSWLRAISDGAHLVRLDWNQTGWKNSDRPMVFHVNNQSISLFCGRLTAFTIRFARPGSAKRDNVS